MNVAVVGSGMAGLTCAWLTSQRHRVTLYELQPALGMEANSVTIEQGGRATRVDVPMRVFFDAYYPILTALYGHLGIVTDELNYAPSFSSLEGELYFQYDNLRLRSLRIPFLTGPALARRSAWRIGLEAVRFFRMLRRGIDERALEGVTLEAYLVSRRFSTDFRERFLLPAYAGICTCSYDAIRNYPAHVILDYLGSGLLWSGVRRVRGGAAEVARRLTEEVSDVRCGTPVVRVQRTEAGVRVDDATGASTPFDHVVFATQANHTRRMLADGTPTETEMLGRFRYESSRVLLHRDPRLAPRKRAWWAPVNFLIQRDGGSRAPMATILMNDIHEGLGPDPLVFQTWNPLIEPRVETQLAEASFERPVVDAGSMAGIDTLEALHQEPGRRVWFCGAYASAGIPLLESAARSAASVARRLGCPLPWEGANTTGQAIMRAGVADHTRPGPRPAHSVPGPSRPIGDPSRRARFERRPTTDLF